MDFESDAVDLESLDGSHTLGRRSFLIGALATGAAASAPLNYAARARARPCPSPRTAPSSSASPPGSRAPTASSSGPTSASPGQRTSPPARRQGPQVRQRCDREARHRPHQSRPHRQPNVHGLNPPEQYFYRFVTGNSSSPIGRFRTAPPIDSKTPIKIVYYSCQNYQNGFYNAQRAIAKEHDIDLVVCLGDYIYESNQTRVAGRDRTDATGTATRSSWTSSARSTTSTRTITSLQAMHAAHPFIAIWDDHESENNNAGATKPQHAPGQTNNRFPRRVPYLERRANGYKAFFNYHPRIRFKGERNRIYEDYRLGKLIDLILTDERQYRDMQPCSDGIVIPCPEAETPADCSAPPRRTGGFAACTPPPPIGRCGATR